MQCLPCICLYKFVLSAEYSHFWYKYRFNFIQIWLSECPENKWSKHKIKVNLIVILVIYLFLNPPFLIVLVEYFSYLTYTYMCILISNTDWPIYTHNYLPQDLVLMHTHVKMVMNIVWFLSILNIFECCISASLFCWWKRFGYGHTNIQHILYLLSILVLWFDWRCTMQIILVLH